MVPWYAKPAYLFLRLFYCYVGGINPFVVIGTVFFLQKIVGFNRFIPWPVHFTSRVTHRKKIKLGTRSFPGFSAHCYIQARNGIIIGNNLRMGPGVGLISANHNIDDYDKWPQEKPIQIGNNVWLGMNTVVMPGVTIGDNVVIGANSVVNADIPDNSLAAGIPCKIICEKKPYQGKAYTDSNEKTV